MQEFINYLYNKATFHLKLPSPSLPLPPPPHAPSTIQLPPLSPIIHSSYSTNWAFPARGGMKQTFKNSIPGKIEQLKRNRKKCVSKSTTIKQRIPEIKLSGLHRQKLVINSIDVKLVYRVTVAHHLPTHQIVLWNIQSASLTVAQNIFFFLENQIHQYTGTDVNTF